MTKVSHIMLYCAKLLCGDAGVPPADATVVAKSYGSRQKRCIKPYRFCETNRRRDACVPAQQPASEQFLKWGKL